MAEAFDLGTHSVQRISLYMPHAFQVAAIAPGEILSLARLYLTKLVLAQRAQQRAEQTGAVLRLKYQRIFQRMRFSLSRCRLMREDQETREVAVVCLDVFIEDFHTVELSGSGRGNGRFASVASFLHQRYGTSSIVLFDRTDVHFLQIYGALGQCLDV